MSQSADYCEDSTKPKDEQDENQTCIQICRNCLSVDGIIPVDCSLSQSYTEVTGVEWDVERLPSALCFQCKALVTKCQTFREKAQRVNDSLMHLMIGNDRNLTNINRMQLGIKPLLEPRHYPPNHCDLYHDADDLKKAEYYVKIELTEYTPESTQTIPHEYSNRHVVNSFGDQCKSPKREVFDSICRDDFLNEKVDIAEDIKDDHLINSATTVVYIPDFRYTESEPSTSIVNNDSETNIKEFICDKCNLNFKTREILIRHLSICDLSLKKSRKDLKPHTVQPGMCRLKSSQTCKLKVQMKGHTKKKPHVCHICVRRFNRNQHLKNHMRTHTGEKPHTCNICGRKFSRLDILKTHMKTHEPAGEKTHACNICDRKFSRPEHLKIHMKIHTEEEPCASKYCDVCGRESSRLDLLKKHMKIHTGEKRYACNTCDRKFSRSDHLKKHMAIHTGEKPHACNICDHKFSRTDHLKKHMKTHNGEKQNTSTKDLKSHTEPYVCDFCGYKSAHAFNLKTHLRTHTGEKPYTCSVCDSKFSLPGGLKTHMRTHTGEKPYTCSICCNKYARLQHLNDHMRTHTGEKPHACNICEFKFSRPNHLKVHMRTHTGEKPFACNICDLQFAQSFNLKAHMRTHTREKPYACNDCDFKCSYRKSFITHLKSHEC